MFSVIDEFSKYGINVLNTGQLSRYGKMFSFGGSLSFW